MSQPEVEQPRWSSPYAVRPPVRLFTPDTPTERPTRHVTIDTDEQSRRRPAVAAYRVHGLLSAAKAEAQATAQAEVAKVEAEAAKADVNDPPTSHLNNSASNPSVKQGGDVRRWTRDAPAPPSTADGRRSSHRKQPTTLPKLAAADLARSPCLLSPAVERGWASICGTPHLTASYHIVPHAEPHMTWRSPLLEAEVGLQAASISKAELHASSREERCMLAVQPLGIEPNLNLLLPLLLPLPLLMPLPLPLSRTTPEPTSVAAPRHARFAAVALPAGARAVHRGTPPVRLRTR